MTLSPLHLRRCVGPFRSASTRTCRSTALVAASVDDTSVIRTAIMVHVPGTAVLIGAVVVLAFDTVGAIASRRLGFAYSRLAPGSFLIYSLVGMAVGRSGSLGAAAASGAAVAFVEATIGWMISWRIGPGRPPGVAVPATSLVRAIIIVTITGASFGVIGGGLAQLVTA
jgi:hypothetical protein